MKVVVIPVTPLEQNCSILYCEATRRGAVVDPGGDIERIVASAAEERVEIEKILVTHGHVDHAGGVAELAEQLGVPVEGPHEEDRFWLEALPQAAIQFGLPAVQTFVPDRWLRGGDQVTVGRLTLDVLHCPGHTPGHVVFFEANSRLAIVGDVLFQGSIGRTDFPRGDLATLVHSIRETLFGLGDDIEFIPGHGPTSTFGEERRSNPFIGDSSDLINQLG